MRLVTFFTAALLATTSALGQAPRPISAADYARAEKFLGYNTTPLVLGAPVRPSWMANDRFWYRNTIAEGV